MKQYGKQRINHGLIWNRTILRFICFGYWATINYRSHCAYRYGGQSHHTQPISHYSFNLSEVQWHLHYS